MWQAWYRHIAAEVSPWAAHRLEFATERPENSINRSGSWSQSDVRAVAALNSGKSSVLWGCDMEELRPHFLIRELAAANPKHPELQSAAELAKAKYERTMAPKLLDYLRKATETKDLVVGGVSLRSSILRTLEIDVDRMSANSRLQASLRREALMKELLHQYWQQNAKPKLMLRFGRNHLHRGYDRRGVSTLGNFVAELAVVQGVQAFNVAEFSGGGTISWGPAGQLSDFDERNDDPAFAFLASIARYAATVFDLRPIRQALHHIPQNKRSSVEAGLVYWADSYDAIIFYRQVTPIQQ
jgi:erythromycin esterase-like protein